ncbi:trypsin-like peptidase domain-containing protein [Dactylosporangium sp. NPDC050688]|uniref:S1 family peptidase n=1 Tax=Dactylosporangium sp. NPDC050688 TaxID=3157217 RepID=UPI0033E35500
MPRHIEPKPDRVARVVLDIQAANKPFSTGYRISDRLVLTAAHGLDNASIDDGRDGLPILVDLDGDGEWRRVTCVWRDKGADLALLRFDDPLPGRVEPVRLGRVDRTRAMTVSAQAMGYPKHTEITDKVTKDSWRGRAQTLCQINTANTGKPGTLRVQIDSTPAPTPPGDSPWKGMSGAAVFTGHSHLLVGVFREHLPAAGASAHEITRLDAVADQRWRDLLRAEGICPDPRPVFPDRWNETCRHLTPHGDYIDDLAARWPSLTADGLSFVDPGDHPSAPENVLAVLTDMASGAHPRIGLMLTGIPGIGKTRLCLETAALADRKGWNVVHLRVRVSLEDVWKSVEALPSRVLLVVEDIELLADTSMKTIDDLRAEARNKGVEMAILTAARSTALRYVNSWTLMPRETFEEVEVRCDQHYQANIGRRAVQSLAKDAVEQAGEAVEAHLVRICRGIPAIAVLLAAYYNGEVIAGRSVGTAVPLGAQGIAGWLRKVLDREELRLPSVGPSEPDPEPDGVLVTTAWIAAAAPLDSKSLEERLKIRGKILSRLGREWKPQNLVDLLCRAGVLARRGDTVRVVHDLYADQLLGEVLVERDSETIRLEILHETLKPGLSDHHVLRNVARAVNRLREALDDKPGDALVAAVQGWCGDKKDRTAALRTFLGRDPDGQTLHTLLRLPTWQHATRRLVEPVAEIWLQRHFREPRARDGVFAVASCLDPRVGYPYLLGWITNNATNPAAAYAFHRLSPPEDLDSEFGEWTMERAFKWLAHHALHPSASFVLDKLLNTHHGFGLPHDHPLAARLVAWARAWLQRNGATPNASYVAPRLVQRPELTGRELEATARFLLDTVAPREPHNASFALVPVLRRHRHHGGLPDDVFDQAVKDSLRWLQDKRYGRGSRAMFVLENLISPDLPGRDDLPRAVRLALEWLRLNAALPEAGRIMKPLLDLARKETDPWARLAEDESAEVARLTLSWLSNPQSVQINRIGVYRISVLGALLHTRLLDDNSNELRQWVEEALRLYQQTPNPMVGRALLPPLLNKRTLPAEFRTDLLDAAFDQLRRHPRSEHTAHPLTSLLRRTDLTAEEYGTAMTATLGWLDAHPFRSNAILLLSTALQNRRADRADRGKLADRAVNMLTRRLLESKQGHDLIKKLLTHRADTTPEWNRFVARSCHQVTAANMPPDTAKVLRLMLKGADLLDGRVLESLHTTCISWCAANSRSNWVLDLLPPVLGNRALPPPARRRASEIACEGLGPDTARVSSSGRLLVALLRDGDLGDATTADRVVKISLDWLDVWLDSGNAFEVLQQVAHRLRQDYGAGRARVDVEQRAVGHLDAWPDRHPRASPEQRATAEAHRRALGGPGRE